MDDVSQELLARLRRGDQDAAREVVRDYTGRLIALARSRLSPKLQQRLDPEDVVQSAYRSFFAGARDFQIRQGDDLWRLLVAITLHKLHDQVEYHYAGKRAVQAQEHFGSEDSLLRLIHPDTGREPSPLEAVLLVDMVEHIMRQFEPDERRMLELRLQGFNLDEIGEQVGCSRQTVRRVLERVRASLHP